MLGIKTVFTEMLGIDYPIIGAPMFLVSYEELAVAVSRAGGLGTIPLPNYRTLADLKKALESIRKATDKPIGVNIHLSGKFPWKEQLALCLDYGVRFFLTALGDPRLIANEVHACGGKVFAGVVSLEQGLRARNCGVDGLVAVGAGGGGHCGSIPALILVPYLKEKVGLPVIAAGGISTGAQMAAAIAVGACAVIVGTRLIATSEARAAQAYKDAVIAAGPEDIVVTDRITGNPASWLAKSIEKVEKQPQLGSKRWLDIWSAGQSVAQVGEIKPAGEIIKDMAREYSEVCRCLKNTLVP